MTDTIYVRRTPPPKDVGWWLGRYKNMIVPTSREIMVFKICTVDGELYADLVPGSDPDLVPFNRKYVPIDKFDWFGEMPMFKEETMQ